MARRRVNTVGLSGILFDPHPSNLPLGVWTEGKNVRFDRDRVVLQGGVAEEADIGTVPGLLWAGFSYSGNILSTLYADSTDVFAFDGTNTANITRNSGGGYDTSADNLWNMVAYNGFVILNNGVDIPQQWSPTLYTNKLSNLSGWDSGWRAQVLVGHGPFLVAMNMVDNGVLDTNRIHWSHPGVPLALPTSWNAADKTKLAGTWSLSDTGTGSIRGAISLGDTTYIFKDKSVHSMRFVGGQAVFAFRLVEEGLGLDWPRAVAKIPIGPDGRAKIFFAGEDNFYLFDGIGFQPAFDRVFAEAIRERVSPTHFRRSFAVTNYRENELWICIPEGASEYCTAAYVWNYRNNTYSRRDLSGCLSIASGIGFGTGDLDVTIKVPYDDSGLFMDYSGFQEAGVINSRFSLLEASVVLEKHFYLDIGDKDYSQVDYWLGYVGRESMPFSSNSRGEVFVDYFTRKTVQSVVPVLYDGLCSVQIGVQETEAQPIFWGPQMEYNTDCFELRPAEPTSGRLISLRFHALPGADFELAGFAYEFQPLGRY